MGIQNSKSHFIESNNSWVLYHDVDKDLLLAEAFAGHFAPAVRAFYFFVITYQSRINRHQMEMKGFYKSTFKQFHVVFYFGIFVVGQFFGQ